MIAVTLYSRKGCKLCEDAEEDLRDLQNVVPHNLKVIDIDAETSLRNSFILEIPVVEAGRSRLKAPFTRRDLKRFLEAIVDQHEELKQINGKPIQANTPSTPSISRADHFSFWLSKHYLAIFNVFLLLYVGVPFLAPVFKKVSWNVPAELIYKVYKPLCHQWAFRSFFLFGEQAFYPREEARIPDVLTFEQVSGITDLTDPGRLQARLFEGTPVLGYKIALCERDVAIWGAMALFGLIFSATGRRLPKLHWIAWMLVGLVPVGLDGFSQLLSQIPLAFIQTYIPYRESTPLLRVITGFLFGMTTAWFMFPLIEETMADTRRSLSKRFTNLKIH